MHVLHMDHIHMSNTAMVLVLPSKHTKISPFSNHGSALKIGPYVQQNNTYSWLILCHMEQGPLTSWLEPKVSFIAF